MNIKTKKTKTKTFGEIANGEVFNYCGTHYMKVYHSADILDGLNTVNLLTGELNKFPNHFEVVRHPDATMYTS